MLALRHRFGAILALIALCLPAAAATIAVDNNADPNGGAVNGDGNGCTLRKALQNIFNDAQTFTDCTTAPTVGGPNTITFSAGGGITQGTSGPFPGIKNQVTITGPKTITGNNSDAIFVVNASGGDLTITGLTLTGAGNSAIRVNGDGKLSVAGSTFDSNTTGGSGGAIRSEGPIAIATSSFTGNTAPSGTGQGGAIWLSGTHESTISITPFTNNSAGQDGGAIYVSLTSSITPSTLTITGSVFTTNTASGTAGKGGGAIRVDANGTLSVLSCFDCKFFGNKADGAGGRGGAIFNGINSAQTIVDHGLFGDPLVLLTGNSANADADSRGGAIYTNGNIIVRTSSFHGNDAGAGKGGAIASDASGPLNGQPGAMIANSTISGNTAAEGAGIYSFAASGSRELLLYNVTLDGNNATTAGRAGGILNENVGGGEAYTRLRNTIISNNKSNSVDDNCSSIGISANPIENIVGNLQFPGATCVTDVAINPGDPKLDTLSINPPDLITFTRALQAGSAALRAGDSTTCTNFPVLNFDQRLMIRPQGGTPCDIGAYESSREPGYGSAPAPAATITINTFSGVPQTSNVVISETGDDHLTIASYNTVITATASITAGPAAPFTINDGAANQTLTITCQDATPSSTSGTLTVSHNAPGSPATYTVNCIVVDPLVITTATPLASHTVNIPGYSQTLAATGGTAPYNTWIVTLGALPTGLTLNPANGAITGTPTAVGTFNFTVQVSDSAAIPLTATKAFSIDITAAPVPPTITTASPLPGGTAGTPYPLLTFAATGGTPPYTMWAFSGGTPPPGLSVAANGDLTGTPTTPGVYNFDVTVTDSTPLQGTKSFQLTVVAPPIVITTASPLPGGTTGTPYPLLTFAATGGTPPYNNWAFSGGTPPPGLSVAANGDLTGTPTLAGVYTFDVTVTDSLAQQGTKSFQLTVVAPPLVITTGSPLPGGIAGTPYPLLTFAATGGTPPYVNWVATIPAQLPPGLSINPVSGALTGTPTIPGVYNFTVQVSDSAGVPVTTTKAFSLTIVAPLSITTGTPLPTGAVGSPYNLTFAAAGGTAPYVNWIATVPAQLPPGLSINPVSGALTGTPSTPGVYNFTVQVSDSAGAPLTTTKGFSLTITAGLAISTPSPLPAGTQGVVYSLTFAAVGGTPAYVNWIATVPAQLPPGLSINPVSGALTGTPSLAGVYNFTVQVSDSAGAPATTTKAFSLTINGPLTITTASPLPAGTQGVAYGQTFAATGGTPPYVNWIATVPAQLPPGLSINASSGALTGTPTLAGVYNFTVQVSDSTGVPLTTTKAFSLTIGPPVSITTATPLPVGTVGTAYSQTFAATGGTPGYSNWIVTVGTLPAGLTLDPATGALTGTPTLAGTSNFTVQVQDSLAQLATKAFALTINPGPLTIVTTSPLPGGSVGTVYNQTFTAAGGTPPYVNWVVTVGTLPPGLTLAAGSGALTGTPTTAGVYNFTVQVSDSAGAPATTTKAFALTVSGTALSITTATPLPGGTVGTAYSQTFAAAGGTPPYVNWVVTVGTLPPGLTLAAGSGALTGTPTTAGAYNFTVQVSDSAGAPATASKAFALTVTAAGCFTGAAPSGSATACVSGGGATCAFTPGTAQFIPVTGHPSSPPAGTAPSGILFPHGLFAFTLSGCTPGATISMTVTYPTALPPGVQYWKYGPTPSTPTPGWYILPATFGATTATFSIVDGGLGDDDLLANGTVVDQGGPGVPGAGGSGSQQTPTLSEWAMVTLALLILAVAGLGRRRPARLR